MRIRLGAGSEVAGFVEDRVVGQQTFAVGPEDAAVGTHSGGIEQVEVLVDEAEHGDATSRVTGKASQRRLVVGDKTGLEDEVLGGIAGDGQFGKGGDVAAGLLGQLVGAEDLDEVAVEITDRRIELRQCDAQHRHRRSR